MSFEGHPKNSFRASLDGGAQRSLLAAKSTAKRNPEVGGLSGVGIARSEQRRVNQRGGDRHRLNGEQATALFKRKKHQVELINLSRGGAMIEGHLRAKLWDRLELRLGGSSVLDCTVCWVRGDRFGLEFANATRVDGDKAEVDAMLKTVIRQSFPEFDGELGPDFSADEGETEAPHHQQRNAARHAMLWRGILHHDYEWEEVLLRNISTTGALVECEAELPIEARVSLDLGPAGKLQATVCWSHGAQTGLAFAEPFDIHQLTAAKPELTPRAA